MRKETTKNIPRSVRWKKLAEKCGGSSVEIEKVIDRIWGWRDEHWRADVRFEKDDAYDLNWRPPLDEEDFETAIRILGYDKAVELFTDSDLDNLAGKISFVSYLNHVDTPLYNLNELANLIDSFKRYLEDNRSALIRTGYPESDFADSFWLAHRLGRLYFTKFPLALDRDCWQKGRLKYVFATHSEENWSEDAPHTKSTRLLCTNQMEARLIDDEKIYVEDRQIFIHVKFEQAPEMVSFSQDELADIEATRRKVLNTKISILGILMKALRERSAKDLLNVCDDEINRLSSELSPHHADKLLDWDARYTGYDVCNDTESDECGFVLPPGGLTDLLSLIAHCGQEINIGLFTRCWERLHGLGSSSTRAPRLGDKSYFDFIHNGEQQLIDDAYGEFVDRTSEADLFWSKYRGRIRAEVDTKRRVAIHMASYMDALKPRMRAGLPLPPIPVLQLASPISEDIEPFDHSDDFVLVTVGETVYHPTQKQRVVLKILCDAWKSDKVGLSQTEIEIKSNLLAREKTDDANEQLKYTIGTDIASDIFRTDDPEGRRALITFHRKFYSLNCPSRKERLRELRRI